jgi:NAD(P)-dependent dehydrogenase (short-subunit alcohol dehydrogenase family)
MAGWAGSATMGTYSASKAAVSMYAEALRDEVEEFGIKVGALEPGGFRSNLLGSKNMKGPSQRIKDYDDSKTRRREVQVGQLDQNQPGDVLKGVQVMVDVILGTGVAEGKNLPGRLIIGSDAYEIVTSLCKNHVETFDQWKSIITQTDYE